MVTEDGDTESCREPIEHIRRAVGSGRPWPEAVLEAMALWSIPEETHGGRHYRYFVGGEAFDWVLLAERLCAEVSELIPSDEREDLLFEGRLPYPIDDVEMRDLIGVHKYRGYLNFFYGVTVEEALQTTVEAEVHKRHASNGNRYQDDFTDEAFQRIYRRTRGELVEAFREESHLPSTQTMSLTELREFTYWLFKYRVKNSEKAKIASDTGKGLRYLDQIAPGQPAAPRPGAGSAVV